MKIPVVLVLVIPVVLVLLLLLFSSYVKAPPDKAFIISGLKREPKILIGRAGFKLPFFERKDTLILKQIGIDIKTQGYVPTLDFIGVDIDAVAKVVIDTSPEGMAKAMKNFLNMDEEGIVASLTDSLQGNMREIIGTVELRELNTDRKKFGDEVQNKAQVDMNALGIQIISCNIQRIEDEQKLINALGQDNMSKIQKEASIAKANADRDVAIAQAKAKQASNDEEVKADLIIAEKQNELEIKKADLKKEADIKKAIADAAYKIQEEEQRKTIEVTRTNADIAKQEREVELKQKEAEVEEQALNAEVKKKADAEKYRVEKAAEAELARMQRDAEAKKYQEQMQAEARKAKAEAERFAAEQEAAGIKAKYDAEASGISAKGRAEAEAVRAKGLAEAEALDKKAEAMKKYGEAAVLEMVIKALPEMAKAVAEPLNSIDKVTIIDGASGGESGVGQMGGYVPTVLAKTIETVKESTGIDIREIMKANTFEAKTTRNINVKGLEGLSGIKHYNGDDNTDNGLESDAKEVVKDIIEDDNATE